VAAELTAQAWRPVTRRKGVMVMEIDITDVEEIKCTDMETAP
jgi:hypothetical protein